MQSLFLSQWSNNVDKLMHIEQITQNNLLFCLHMHKWCKESWNNITYASGFFFQYVLQLSKETILLQD